MNEAAPVHAYAKLSPDLILAAVDSVGFRTDGRVSALNSYENRVYQIGIEDSAPLVAKFYRPARWSDEAILEEHTFTIQLQHEYELPVIAPLRDSGGRSLFTFEDFRFALYPRVGGRAPEPDNAEHLLQIGRCLARIHNVGATAAFAHRPRIGIDEFAVAPRDYLLQNDLLPADLLPAYESVSAQLVSRLEELLAALGDTTMLRLHGDFHIGNILWQDGVPLVVDFDDARCGPAIQDLWMLLPGGRAEMTAALDAVLEGYTAFRRFDARELRLVEPLRTLRLMHYAGWLARRLDDPAFAAAFPWFNTQRYWQDHILTLREQLANLDEAPLVWHD